MVLLLEIARGLAALWVFLFHIQPLFSDSSPFIHSFSSFGALGVPMFFVISGYVITYSAESSLNNSRSPLVFIKARFMRIYPTFWASIIVVLLVPYIIELISYFKTGQFETPPNIIDRFSLYEWANLLLLIKVFWATSHDLQAEFNTVNSVYWTLAIEFQFYLVVYLALVCKKYYKHIIGITTLIAFALPFMPITVNHGLFIHYWPSFSLGILLAYLHTYNFSITDLIKNSSIKYLISAITFLAIILLSPFLENRNYLFPVMFVAFLWSFSHFEHILIKVKNHKAKFIRWVLEPWLILGTMSYSVYLLHGKLYALPAMFVRQAVIPTTLIGGLLTIIGTLLLCYPFYFLIERRFLSKNYQEIHKQIWQ